MATQINRESSLPSGSVVWWIWCLWYRIRIGWDGSLAFQDKTIVGIKPQIALQGWQGGQEGD